MVRVSSKKEKSSSEEGPGSVVGAASWRYNVKPHHLLVLLVVGILHREFVRGGFSSRATQVSDNSLQKQDKVDSLTTEVWKLAERISSSNNATTASLRSGTLSRAAEKSDANERTSKESNAEGKVFGGCSSLQKRLIAKSMPTGQSIIDATICPNSQKWLSDYLMNPPTLQQSPEKPFVFLNFGCNKGFDALEVANTVSRRSDVFAKSKWLAALGIGGEGACKQALGGDVKFDSSFSKQAVEVHCVEAMPVTAEKLKKAAITTSAAKFGFHIHHYAMTSQEEKAKAGKDTIAFPNLIPGTENRGTSDCRAGPAKDSCTEVPAITIDEFVSKHIDANKQEEGQRIPFMAIDVEGGDYTIMQSATATLKRTDYLEFEYHARGDWRTQKLKDAIEMLKRTGFVCYWAGINRLWRITDCWMDYFEFHNWSNVACVAPKYAPGLFTKMEAVFEDTIVDGSSGVAG